MFAKFALSAGAAGLVVGAGLFALPQDLRLPVAGGVAVLGFVFYALRERSAVRQLNWAVRRAVDLESTHLPKLETSLQLLEQQSKESQDVSRDIAQVTKDVRRFHEIGEEITTVHAAATSEILAKIGDRFDAVDRRLGHGATQTELRRIHNDALLSAARDFRQVEALIGLHSLFRVRAPLPHSRKWAASPDLLMYLASLVFERRPRLIVELGGGLSTVWLSYALEKVGDEGRIVSLDHDARFAEMTRALLSAHHLDHIAEVRDAPLTDLELDGEKWSWYDTSSMANISGCDLLFVDGPPAATRQHARYPAFPMMVDRMASRGTIVVDDCIRPDEKEIVAMWSQRYPGWNMNSLDHEKATTVFTR